MQETMMVGLRMTQEGVSDVVFTTRFGISMRQSFPAQIDMLYSMGLFEWHGDRLRLTRRGWLLGNRVFREFVSLPEPPGLFDNLTGR
jgi:oxygen-independent coproporphyrinogen III oxidase